MKIETRKGLWVSSFFTEQFGNKDITPAKTVPSFKVLRSKMNDNEILAELKPAECTLEEVAAFLENPPEGTDDGYWNLFYVRGLVVRVRWYAGNGYWGVGAWRQGDYGWRAERRVFSGNFGTSDASTQTLSSLTSRVECLEDNVAALLEKLRSI